MSLKIYDEMSEKQALLLNPLQLAYVGDSVWETVIRGALVCQGLNVHHMHNMCVGYVNAHGQACCLKQIEDRLFPVECEIVRRGRNAHARHPSPKNQNPEDYSTATGFEALIGFLYLTGKDERILEFAVAVIKREMAPEMNPE